MPNTRSRIQADTQEPKTVVTIRDSGGNIVHSKVVSLNAGKGTYSWDGKNLSGVAAPDGVYTITIDAKGADGNTVKADTTVSGVVSGVDFGYADPVLNIGGVQVNLSQVKEVKAS